MLRDLLARLPPLPTTLVGSYVQPDWLIDRHNLGHRAPPRILVDDLWRVARQHRLEAQDDATQLAVREQERAGLDIIGDGEMRRESYSATFAAALEGIDPNEPGVALDRRNKPSPVPRVVASIGWRAPILARDLAVLRGATSRPVKITLPGPFTLSQLSQDDHYRDPRALALAFAAAVNCEIRALHAAGADIVQLDEPYLEARPDAARRFGIDAINHAVQGAAGVTALHVCFGYGPIDRGFVKPGAYAILPELERCAVDILSIEAAQPRLEYSTLRCLPSKVIMLGVLDLGTVVAESVATIRERILRALQVVGPERLVIAPDCGMKYLPRASAAAKVAAMVAGAQQIRSQL